MWRIVEDFPNLFINIKHFQEEDCVCRIKKGQHDSLLSGEQIRLKCNANPCRASPFYTWRCTPQLASHHRPAWPAPVDKPSPSLSGRAPQVDSALLREARRLQEMVHNCVCVCVSWGRGTGAFPGRRAGVNVRYEIRMQYKQRDAFKLN